MMSRIRGKNTTPELRVRKYLHAAGCRYRLHVQALPGTPDVVFVRKRTCLFVHGCFWHMHDCRYGKVVPATNAGFWQQKRAGNVARDQACLEKLATLGWKVFVAWECEIKDPQPLADRLVSFLTLE